MPPPIFSPGSQFLVTGAASEGARAEIARLLRKAKKVVLTSHEKTDADGAGSALGLLHALRSLGIDAHAAFPSRLPANLQFLPGAAEAHVVEAGNPIPEALRNPDCLLSLDAGAASRLGALQPLSGQASVFLNVDHHASNEGFGTHRWVDPTYAAVGTMAFEIVCELGIPLSRETCLCFYTALVYDTGGFAFSNTDSRSHRMAAACLEHGVRAEEVTARLHRSRSLASWSFAAEAIARLRTSEDGAVAWIAIPRDLIARHGLAEGDQPDLIDVPVSLSPTRIALLLTELPGGAGVRVSLRSRCVVAVHTLAARFGGGGHARAAGMTLPGSLEDAEKAVVAEVRTALAAISRSRLGPGALPLQDA